MTENRKRFLSTRLWIHFRKNKPASVSLYILFFLVLIALLAPVIANDKPLYAKYNGEIFFPAFSFSDVIVLTNAETGRKEFVQASQLNWKQMKLDKVVWAPVEYAPGKSDPVENDYISPSAKKHLLGTTKNGSDVLSGLLYGTRISLSIGILAMLIASLIGITLGSIAGYFGDQHLSASRASLWMIVIGIIPGYFYGFHVRSDSLSTMFQHPGIGVFWQLFISIFIFVLILFVFFQAGKLFNGISFFSRKVFVRMDSLVSRTIEIFISIPRLILIISLAAIARPSFTNLILIIGFTSWTEIARFTRAELLRSRNSDYIENARAIGLPDYRIILKHALPNALAPATIAIVFGIASAILIESGLSFLGIGVPQDVVTWGSLLSAGKENFEAWWLVIFPGIFIFITVTAFNLVGDGLRDAMDVKGRM